MSSALKCFTPTEVIISFCNQTIDSGWADGDFLTIAPLEPAYSAKRGTDGETTRSESLNKGRTFKLKLMHTSEGNSILQQIHNLDRETPGGAGVGMFEVRDRNNGALVISAPKTWITGPPEAPFGKEVSDREWTLECAAVDREDYSGYPSK